MADRQGPPHCIPVSFRLEDGALDNARPTGTCSGSGQGTGVRRRGWRWWREASSIALALRTPLHSFRLPEQHKRECQRCCMLREKVQLGKHAARPPSVLHENGLASTLWSLCPDEEHISMRRICICEGFLPVPLPGGSLLRLIGSSPTESGVIRA